MASFPLLGDNRKLKASQKKKKRSTAIARTCDTTQQPQPQQGDQASAPATVKRSSRFRGVSRHIWTGRYEAHLWDKLSWNVTQKKKGKQGNFFVSCLFTS